MDVIVKFLREPPRRIQLMGEWWSISLVPTRAKSSKHWALVASCDTDHREHCLCSGPTGMVRDQMAQGFLVKSGTPLRGLVSSLRRAGIVSLSAQPVPVDDEVPPF